MSTNFLPVEIDGNCAEVEEDEDDELEAKAKSDDEENEDEEVCAVSVADAVDKTPEISAVEGLAAVFRVTLAFFLLFINIFCRRTAFLEQRALTIMFRSETPFL